MADTYVRDGRYATKNFGALGKHYVKSDVRLNQGYNRDAYLKFDISELASIQSAKLRFFASLSYASKITTTAFTLATETWGERTLNWNNRPDRALECNGVTISSTKLNWYEIDVSNCLKNAIASGKKTFSIALHNKSTSNPYIQLYSRESKTGRPSLIIMGEPLFGFSADSKQTSPRKKRKS